MTRSRKTRGLVDPYAKYRNSGWDWFINEAASNPNDPQVLFKIRQFKCPCNDPFWSEWESPLAGADEGEQCENPICKDNGPIMPCSTTISPTPCSFSKEKYYGEFLCHKCSRYWHSSNTWTGTYQKCEECIICVYPYYLDEKPFARVPMNKDKPHPPELCERCISTKTNCAELTRSGTTSESDNNPKRFYRRPRRNRKNRKNMKEVQALKEKADVEVGQHEETKEE